VDVLEKRESLAQAGIEPEFLGCQFHNLVAIPTALHDSLNSINTSENEHCFQREL
jgi:hypothetical protein